MKKKVQAEKLVRVEVRMIESLAARLKKFADRNARTVPAQVKLFIEAGLKS